MRVFQTAVCTLKVGSCKQCPGKKAYPIKDPGRSYRSGWGCTKLPTTMTHQPDGSLGKPRMQDVTEYVNADGLYIKCPLPGAE